MGGEGEGTNRNHECWVIQAKKEENEKCDGKEISELHKQRGEEGLKKSKAAQGPRVLGERI